MSMLKTCCNAKALPQAFNFWTIQNVQCKSMIRFGTGTRSSPLWHRSGVKIRLPKPSVEGPNCGKRQLGPYPER